MCLSNIRIILYVAEIGMEVNLSSTLEFALLATALILPVGITVIIGFALRPIREQYHNAREYTHRYVGWFVVADLIVHLVVMAFTLASPCPPSRSTPRFPALPPSRSRASSTPGLPFDTRASLFGPTNP
ncbi:hypothetical protein FRC09_008344 [Ceratobasidium sp. 395]|nr:hypothetical protein FRC09_008344 [Ceratobasidium sp. 395]